MLEDQRKRTIDASIGNLQSQTSRKKPMLSTHPLNDQSAHDESTSTSILVDQDEKLENFRKEALWRQLREYKRDLRRAETKLSQIEDQKTDAEARLAAVDVCWNQLVEDVRMLFKDTNSTTLEESASTSLLSPQLLSSPTSLDRALQQRSTASKDLIVHLISLASSSSLVSPELEELRSRCRRLTQESATSRAALSLAESKVKQLLDQLELCEESARRAEKKFDRERSRTVRELDAQGQGPSQSAPPIVADLVPPPPAEEVVAFSNSEGLNGSVPANNASEPINGTVMTAISAAVPDPLDVELEEMRTRELEMLKDELLHRAHDIDTLHWKLANLPDEVVHESPAYKRLKAEMAHATLDLERAKASLESAQREADELRERQDEFRDSISADMTSRIEDLEKKLLSRDTDITRIRSTREEARSELHELKSRDAEKMRQVAQIRTLANSRQDRINALSSEVRRLKMRLAAEGADRLSVEFLSLNEEIEFAKCLQEKLLKAEETIKAYKEQVERLSTDTGILEATQLVESEAEARAELSFIRRKALDRTRFKPEEEINGSPGAGCDGSATVQVLEAKLAAQEASATMLYTEVDRLSTAWAALDEQNRDKVFKLAEHDEKVLKAVHEKAKADNRYFSAMRANETLKSQTSVLEKVAEKQTVSISKLGDELRAVSSRLSSAEREITLHQKIISTQKSKMNELSIENAEYVSKCSAHEQRMNEVLSILRERTSQVEHEAAGRRRAEEGLIGLEKELNRFKGNHIGAGGLGGTSGSGMVAASGGLTKRDDLEIEELKSFNEDLTKMLKCNSCKQRFKSHVITRCMHLFCGACLEARIETRQRKCPTCSVGFGVGDVAAVYF